MTQPIAIHWFRRDLRLADNAALASAAAGGTVVIPVFVVEDEGEFKPGAATRWWLHHSLSALDAALRERGSRLVLRRGPAAEALAELARETGATRLTSSRRYEPCLAPGWSEVRDALGDLGVDCRDEPGFLLYEPDEIETRSGGPYSVFTPFWKALAALGDPPEPIDAPASLVAPERWPAGLALDELELLPRVDWAGGLRECWSPGESAAAARLEEFTSGPVLRYVRRRNGLDEDGTSSLSPRLAVGELSPRQVWHAARRAEEFGAAGSAEPFLRQLAWRDFAWHVLAHNPETTHAPLRDAFRRFPWARRENELRAWQLGRTGYPIVDAGMRQLWRTGWMHNRARMVVASFLTKDLLVDWRDGAAWFWDTLVDADLGNNTFGWQWTAGCGADAAPYFRIFNPVLQSRRFDPEGQYIRRYVPELAGLDAKWIHEPWNAPESTLAEAGVDLGETYPRPIVDHAVARDAALAAYETVKAGG